MKKINRVKNTLKGLTDAITRFPLTTAFLLGAAVINAIAISTDDDYSKYLLTLVVGAFLGAAAQVAYERFYYKSFSRIVLNGAAALLTLGYYLIIMPAPELSMEIGVRTSVALFALLIAFIWIPAIKSKISFNECFMVAFKGFFIALFFAGILFAGTSLIIAATNELLFTIDSEAYSHAANIIFILFAPIYFLSLIPVYYGKRDQYEEAESLELKEDRINKMANCPKYLEILISYIIIPLATVFTLILTVYIVINIGSEFWTDNLLEPMIVSYSITVILVYILASNLENRFAVFFRKIFPKVLVPIVVFQTIASIMRVQDVGITYSRYYVIIFGIFATISGVLFSFLPVRKNGIIAAILIVLSAISIIPPVDAFTVSKNNQIAIYRNILLKNNMLENNSIKPNAAVSSDDKKRLVGALQYLNRMDYTGQIPYLPSNFNYYSDFERTFGFTPYEDNVEAPKFVYLRLEHDGLIDISGHDAMARASIHISDMDKNDELIGRLTSKGKSYTLKKQVIDQDCIISLADETDYILISFSTKEIFDKYKDSPSSTKGSITLEEATFSTENERAKLTIIIETLNMETTSKSEYYAADIYTFVKIKD